MADGDTTDDCLLTAASNISTAAALAADADDAGCDADAARVWLSSDGALGAAVLHL